MQHLVSYGILGYVKSFLMVFLTIQGDGEYYYEYLSKVSSSKVQWFGHNCRFSVYETRDSSTCSKCMYKPAGVSPSA